ncbi:MAG: N-6 DNA methylase [Paludibacteraceae bacterium]|nr:N-6 DNA methylase [Paludibacteraceae bacterium]
MITVQNLKEVLLKLGFAETSNGVFKKQYPHDASIMVDFNQKKITYAPIDSNFANGEYPTKERRSTGFVIHRDTTLDFSHNENFVCLVCVHLLLEKGYEPKHIIFEPAFRVGHINKPSYGDILVYNEQYNPLVLIENKTYGAEFSKEWNNMQKDGGQLFSYLGPLVNELGLCENLVLFAVDFDNNDIVLKNHIITLKDNDNADLGGAKKFKDAQGKYFEVWNETYAKSFETKGLFEQDVVPYSVGKLKYTIADLKSLSHSEIRPIYHEFATILRNHAITDFEHSFYILIDLFLCKITDERRNPDDLQFYYKGITRDTPKKYCARLLKLYQQGKHDLFDVDVVNKDEDDIRQIFEDTSRSLTNGLFDGIRELFEEIKFYNIKKFNFIDVENKEEFEMNFQILIKIAALIQDINLSNSETNHFFGDLFEGLLSKNVHQTEGQFFTPLPIVNFIIKSLPEFPNNQNIKVLDYACGAGHFLTEFVKNYPETSAYGIEKSQTLSQVAKIATIINGSQNAHIVFKDTLSIFNTRESRFQGFDEDSFDLIIANPPYSVKGFLNTLDENDRNQYELAKLVPEKSYGTNRTIESFFVERAKHFLHQNGLLGIVLPSSILSNDDAITVKTRELLFAHFNILSIVSLGSRTFGSTGTNTIILFAQKVKKNAGGLLEHFITDDRYEQYTNYEAIDSYIEKQGYNKDAYLAFMQTDTLQDILENHEIFREYKSAFKNSPIKKATQVDWFKSSTYFREEIRANSQEYRRLLNEFINSTEYKEIEKAEYTKQFIAYAKSIESEKLYTFIQLENNFVLLLQSPPDKINNKSNKNGIIKFLGYDWSNRKGDEGIKYVTKNTYVDEEDSSQSTDDQDAEIVRAINSIRYIDTPLYNPDEAWDNTKYAFALRKHIYDQCKKFSFGPNEPIDEVNQLYEGEINDLLSYSRLVDLIDFSRPKFNKAIKTSSVKPLIVSSKYGLVRIESLLLPIEGAQTKIPQEEIQETGQYPVITQEADKLIAGYTDNRLPITDLPLIVFGDHSCTYKYIDFPFVRGADGTQLIKVNSQIKIKYLQNYLLASEIEHQDRYERHYKYLKDTFIPLPPPDIQTKIIVECAEVDDKIASCVRSIEEKRNQIQQVFESLQTLPTTPHRLSNKSEFDLSIGKRVLNTEVSSDYTIPVYSANVFEPFGMIDHLLIEDFAMDSVLWGIDGDWMVNTIPANNPFYPTDHCGVLRLKTNEILPKYMAFLLHKEGHNEGFSRKYRASIDRVEGITIHAVSIESQLKVIPQIEDIENEILSLQEEIASCAMLRRNILIKYLSKE